MPQSPIQAQTDNSSAHEFLTSVEVLEKLRISRRTLERYIDKGLLPALRLPSGHRRFRPDDVDALLERESA
jgi:excisionase family DNA binding protein